MNLSCEIVQDLLPLYEDEICSPASREAVEEHLKTCPTCRGQVESVRNFAKPETRETPEEEKAVVKSFRKVRRRWFASLAALLLVIPMILMCVNQYRGQGICFTNLDDIWQARKYCAALAAGDFEKASGYMNYEGLYEEIQDILSWEPEDYLGSYRKITIGDEEYMVNEAFPQEDLEDSTDALAFWSGVVFNGMSGYLVSEEIWQKVCAMEPDAVEALAGGGYQVNGAQFDRLETDWGVFYTVSGEISDCETAEEIAEHLSVIPVEIYQEAEESLIASGLGHYEFNQNYYAAARDMRYEEFREYVMKHYAAELRNAADLGYTFEMTGVQDAYCIEENGGWTIIYGMRVSNGTRSLPFCLDITVRDGGLDIGAMSYQDDIITDFDLAETIFFGYPGQK